MYTVWYAIKLLFPTSKINLWKWKEEKTANKGEKNKSTHIHFCFVCKTSSVTLKILLTFKQSIARKKYLKSLILHTNITKPPKKKKEVYTSKPWFLPRKVLEGHDVCQWNLDKTLMALSAEKLHERKNHYADEARWSTFGVLFTQLQYNKNLELSMRLVRSIIW